MSLLLWLPTVLAVAYALRRAGEDMGERRLPMIAVLAACVFAGQMLNFTVAGGTSGHLVGAALATILLGPWAAVLVMTTVVGVQALIFQDGGLVAMGANIFNMGLVSIAVAYAVYHTVRRFAGEQRWGLFVGGFAAAWCSIVVSSLGVALQLALSGTSPANVAIPTMAGIHALIGIGEGLITVGALAFLYTTRRDLLDVGTAPQSGGRAVWVVGFVMALALAVLSPLASSNPDGLEWVAEQQGFIQKVQGPAYNSFPTTCSPASPTARSRPYSRGSSAR